MNDTRIRDAIENLGAAISADPAKARAKGVPATAPNPGWYLRGAIASCMATVIAMRAAKLGITRTTVKIRGNAEPQTLREIVAWAEGHSPVGCTVKDGPPCSLDIEVV